MPHGERIIKPISFDRMAHIQYLANLQSIRINSFRPYNRHEQLQISDTGSENLDHKLISMGKVYLVVTSISARDITTAATSIELSIVRGGSDNILTSQNIGTANLSCDWSGQTICTEDEKVRAKFVGATSADKVVLDVHGYTIDI